MGVCNKGSSFSRLAHPEVPKISLFFLVIRPVCTRTFGEIEGPFSSLVKGQPGVSRTSSIDVLTTLVKTYSGRRQYSLSQTGETVKTKTKA